MTRFALLPCFAAVVLMVGVPMTAFAEAPAITQVVSIETNGDDDLLLKHAANNARIFERLGINAERSYLRATLAGPNTGTVAVVIAYPSLAELASAQEKLRGDDEWQKYIDKITKSGMTVLSNSIWQDITP
ncbi:MAG: hypothetical protein O7G30_11245 [Proteobacteria bacterium]|nr:hypothetical protein [Pseudomonadota bacterium]